MLLDPRMRTGTLKAFPNYEVMIHVQEITSAMLKTFLAAPRSPIASSSSSPHTHPNPGEPATCAKCSSYAKACQCDFTLRPCGLALPSFPREVKNISSKHFINKKVLSGFSTKRKSAHFHAFSTILLTNLTPTGRPVTGFLLEVKGDSSVLREER